MKRVSLQIVNAFLLIPLWVSSGNPCALAQSPHSNKIPPEVLHALIPNQAASTPQTNHPSTTSYFDASTPEIAWGAGSSDRQDTPARFSDTVFDQLVTDQGLRTHLPHAATATYGNQTSKNHSALNQLPLNQSSPNQSPQNVPPVMTAEQWKQPSSSDEPLVQPAAHVRSFGDAARILPPRVAMKEPASLLDSELFKPMPHQPMPHQPMPHRESSSDDENHAPQSLTLAEMLEQSNREIRGEPDSAAEESYLRSSAPTSATSKTARRTIGENFASSPGLGETIQQIATGLCLVLVLGVGFILVAKKLYRSAASSSTRPSKVVRQPEPASFQIASTIRLDPKSALHLVDVAGERVLVATDSNGVKSMLSLSRSFDALLDEAVNRVNEENEQDREMNDAGTYSPAMRTVPSGRESRTERSTGSRNEPRTVEDVEAEMRKQLAELLGGQAFKDVFLKQTGRVA